MSSINTNHRVRVMRLPGVCWGGIDAEPRGIDAEPRGINAEPRGIDAEPGDVDAA